MGGFAYIFAENLWGVFIGFYEVDSWKLI